MGGWGFKAKGQPSAEVGSIMRCTSETVGWESSLFGMFFDHFLVGSDVHAINFAVRHVAVHPLNLGAQILKYAAGFLRNGQNLLLRQISCLGYISLDHIFRHLWLQSELL